MYKKTFQATLNHLHEMLSFIQQAGEKRKIPAPILNKIVLAAEEALVNIINYGYPLQKGIIEITCENLSERKAGVCVLIKDNGIPFNPIEKIFGNQESLLSEGKIGGYGIYLFIGMMDRVEYSRLNEFNVLSLTKYL